MHELARALVQLDAEAIQEELSHFRCVMASGRAASLHLRHLLTRFAFSSSIRFRPLSAPVGIRREFLEVDRYHWDSTQFFLDASPWFEALFLIEQSEDPKSAEGRLDGLPIALAHQHLKGLNDVDHRWVASHVDAGGDLTRPPTDPKRSPLGALGAPMRLAVEALRFLRYPLVPIVVLRTAWRTRHSLWKYLGERFLGGDRASSEPSRAVGLLTPELTMDPSAWGDGVARYRSQEWAPVGPRKVELDLLWFVLRVAATSQSMLERSVSREKIKQHWDRLQTFYCEIRRTAESENARVSTWACRLTQDVQRGMSQRARVELALKFFQSLRQEVPDNELHGSLAAALNLHYQHI